MKKIIALVLALSAHVALAQQGKIEITRAEVDVAAGTLFVHGQGFGTQPATVVIDGSVLELQSHSPTDLVAALPQEMESGTYRLVIVRAPGNASASMDVTIGAEGPQGPQGPAGPAGQDATGQAGLQGPTGVSGLEQVSLAQIVNAGTTTTQQVIVACPSGKKAIAGGARSAISNAFYGTYPADDGRNWIGEFRRLSTPYEGKVWVICAVVAE